MPGPSVSASSDPPGSGVFTVFWLSPGEAAGVCAGSGSGVSRIMFGVASVSGFAGGEAVVIPESRAALSGTDMNASAARKPAAKTAANASANSILTGIPFFVFAHLLVR